MGELPKREGLRLKSYDYSKGGAYFVTICTQDRCHLLSKIHALVGGGALDAPCPIAYTDLQLCLTPIGRIVEKYLLSSENIPGVKIDGYIIMPDHIHAMILLNPNEYTAQGCGTSRAPSPTNEMLPHVISTFKRFCHKEVGRVIFQRSYQEHIIRDREDYLAHIRYIYENPARWFSARNT
jgi:REP element-mobilizing transposase RayT